jgi:hypothetical protein
VRKPKTRQNIEEFQEQLLELTEKQFEVLKCLAGNRKAVITGGAGTGKTLLAMEKAKQMALQGHRTLFTCSNRLLSKYVRNQLEDIENLEVMNFHELCYKWGKKAGFDNLIDPDGPNRYSLTAEDYSTMFPETLAKASDKLTERFDAVIVDEAQDMKEIYWPALQFCLTEDPVFYIFCDPNQSIWHIRDDLPFNSPTFNLYKNLRNSKKVFEAIKVLCSDKDYDGGCSDEGEFEIILLNNTDEIENKLTSLLTKLINQGFSRRSITIITGKSRDSSFLAGKEAVGKFPLTNNLSDKEDKVLFSSARQYRGMESLAVIMIEVDYIVDLDKLSSELGSRFEFRDNEQLLQQTAKETLLIGMSRAQHSLYILANSETAGKLKEIGLV